MSSTKHYLEQQLPNQDDIMSDAISNEDVQTHEMECDENAETEHPPTAQIRIAQGMGTCDNNDNEILESKKTRTNRRNDGAEKQSWEDHFLFDWFEL